MKIFDCCIPNLKARYIYKLYTCLIVLLLYYLLCSMPVSAQEWLTLENKSAGLPRGLSESYVIYLPLFIEPDLQVEHTYTDADFDIEFQHDPALIISTEFVRQPLKDPMVIEKRVSITRQDTPDGAILIDFWSNPESLSLRSWFDKYEAGVYGANASVIDDKTFQISGSPVILIQEPFTSSAYGRLAILTSFKQSIIRVDYYINDYGENLAAFLHLIRTMRPIGKPVVATIIPDIDQDKIIELKASSIQVQTCCGYTDPNTNAFPCSGGNCTWWAKYSRPDTGFSNARWWNDAYTWRDRARQDGYQLGTSACVDSIAVFQRGEQGADSLAGHVAYVTSVGVNGTFVVSEMAYGRGCNVGNSGVTYPTYRENPANDVVTFIYPASGCGASCPAPTLISPGDGHTLSSRTVTFSWQALSGCGSGYTFRIKDTGNMDAGGTTLVDTGEGGTARTETIPAQYENRDLYWGVKAANATNANWAVRRFRIQTSSGSTPTATPTTIPATPVPNGQVKLYSLANYGGAVLWNGNTGFSNEPNANSYALQIPSGWSVKTWRGDNRSGEDRTWCNSVANLQDHGWQLAIQSIEVYNFPCSSSGGSSTTLCTDDNATQGCTSYNPGLYQLGGTALNDQYRSVKSVAAGKSIMLYRESGFRGVADCFNGSRIPLVDGSDPNWDLRGQVTDFQVFNSASCPTSELKSLMIYRDSNAGGPMAGVGVSAGIYNLGDIGGPVNRNDWASSLRVPAGKSVYLYEHNDRGGERSGCLTGTANLFGSLDRKGSSVWLFDNTTCTPPVPDPPTAFLVSGSTQNSMVLTWSNVIDESGYRLERWSGSSWLAVATVGTDVTTWTQTGLSCGTPYSFRLSAYNGMGSSAAIQSSGSTQSCPPPTPTATFTPLPTLTPTPPPTLTPTFTATPIYPSRPAIPTVLAPAHESVVAVGATVTFRWQPLSYPVNYLIYIDRNGQRVADSGGVSGSDWQYTFTEAGAYSWTISTLCAGCAEYFSGYSRLYTFYVGEPPTATPTARPSSTPIGNAPGAPTNVQLLLTHDHKVYIGWTPASNAERYQIYRSNPDPAGNGWDLIGTTAGISYLDEKVVCGDYFAYGIVAVNAHGTTPAEDTPGITVNCTATATPTPVPTITPSHTPTPLPPTATSTATPTSPGGTPTNTPVPPQAVIAVGETSGAPGSRFIFTGNGFAPNLQLPIGVTPQEAVVAAGTQVIVGLVTTDANGRFTFTLQTDTALAAGRYRLTVGATQPASVQFTVDPAAPVRQPVSLGVVLTMAKQIYLPLIQR